MCTQASSQQVTNGLYHVQKSAEEDSLHKALKLQVVLHAPQEV